MSLKRVTMQEVADACGLSRNTVSKVFNDRGAIADATKKLVYAKAKELGYMQFAVQDSEYDTALSPKTPVFTGQSVTILAHSNPLNHSFGSLFVKAFTDQICRSGYTVQLYELSTDELNRKQLPPHISLENTAAILCIELFDKDFINVVSGLGLPTILVDGYCNSSFSLLPCDFISMENYASSIYLTNSLIALGAKNIGFVGDINHCNSFLERFNGFSSALTQNGLTPDKNICIIENNDSPYGDHKWLCNKIKSMPLLPDAFFCVNDFHAIHIINALKELNISVPNDVLVTGFDNSPESMVIEPSLTTVNIPSTDMGIQAADILLSRIAGNSRPYQLVYIQTTPILRDSTKKK